MFEKKKGGGGGGGGGPEENIFTKYGDSKFYSYPQSLHLVKFAHSMSYNHIFLNRSEILESSNPLPPHYFDSIAISLTHIVLVVLCIWIGKVVHPRFADPKISKAGFPRQNWCLWIVQTFSVSQVQ